jgi:hypothetical protein
MRLLIRVFFLLCFFAHSAHANRIEIAFGFPDFSEPQEVEIFSDNFMNRPLYQNPVGNGWTVGFYQQQPQSSVITSENVWRLANMPEAGITYTFGAAPSSAITEVLVLMRRDTFLTSGISLRTDVAQKNGYGVTFGGTTGIAFFETVNATSYWLTPNELHGISNILTKWVWLRAKMESNTISVKAWEHGVTEPANWIAQRVITSPVETEGFAGILHMGASGTNIATIVNALSLVSKPPSCNIGPEASFRMMKSSNTSGI